MIGALHREVNFESYIVDKITKLCKDGTWRLSKDDTGFNPETALYFNDFVEYVEKTNPEQLDKMKKTFGANWESNLTKEVVKSLENSGTVQTIRNGFPMAGFKTIVCSGHYPDDPRLPKEKELYDNNILRIMRQVHYQTAGQKSLDLVFFINGIPVATAEVKTELTQTVHDAIEEYQTERKPIEPGNRRRNYLLMYKRGAVVHFAISEKEVWMCTNLEPEKPKFLPFNKGNDGHAGNPPMQKNDEEYPTGYFWNEICQKDNWLKIFHNFIFEEKSKKEDSTGKLREECVQIFPRYHQWDCVNKVLADIKTNGIGQKYLIEHSAGSGKTETISWIAHELVRLRDENGDRIISSVIVVTDRVGLDTNIKGTIKQLTKTVGQIAMIGGDDLKKTAGAKSKELSQAITDKREIIVVTLQTFPYALEAIVNDKSLAGANFAVLIDEAHNSQDGTLSGKMKTALKLASDKKKKEDPTAETVTDEELIDAYFEEIQANKVMPANVSFFAFTATPKAETKTLFGRDGSKIDDKTGKPIPESFHLYPMRQAIEEEYIIDVLTGYMPYSTAYKLKEDVVTDKLVDERKAISTIAKWASLHPTNVMDKAEFIIEHFVKNVAGLLGGNAKAMIVTSSRASVVRYKYAICAYLKAHPEYDRDKIINQNLQFKVPGEPLVAFSDTISGEKCIMPEDSSTEFLTEHEYLKENPFAAIKRDYDYSEYNMNNIGNEKVEHAFEAVRNRILIVANKFQVGFNQPKLVAMYIDKPISNDIEIVQTYSRVNRKYPGKDKVFIVDFVNEPEKVLRAFKKYDNGAEMEHAQNLDIIYEIKTKLDNADIYSAEEFEEFKKVKYQSVISMSENKDNYRIKLYKSVDIPANRWLEAYKAQQTAYLTWKDVERKAIESKNEKAQMQAKEKLDEISEELDKLVEFKKLLKKYISAYNFICQIIDLGDASLEVFSNFAQLMLQRIQGKAEDEIDIRSLVLADYRINRIDITGVKGEDGTLKPMGAGGKGKSSKRESLKVIISKINEIWGTESDTVTGARTLNAIADYVATDDVSRVQIRNSTNSKQAVIADGRLEEIIKLAAVSLKNNEFMELADKIIKDPQCWKPVSEVVFDLVDKQKRIDVEELIQYLRTK